MPIRKIPKNYRNVTGIAASGKAIGSAQFESTLERDFLALVEFSSDVEDFEVQPVKIEWYDNLDTPRSYTPDALVTFAPATGKQPWLCEIKYRADIKKYWDTLHPKFLKGISYAKQHGWKFRIITEVEIRNPYLDNVRFLMPFRFRQTSASMIDSLLRRLNTLGHTTPAKLIANMSEKPFDQAEWLPVIWHLIAQHQIGTDLETPLNMNSSIWGLP